MNKKTTLLIFALFMALFCRAKINTTVVALNDDWMFRQCGSSNWQKAKVPGTVHTDLLRNKKIQDPYYRLNEHELQWIDKCDWEYKTTFTPSSDQLKAKNNFLRFNGLDTYADVYLNNEIILSADNMFRTWNVDVNKKLRKGDNEIRIVFHSAVNKGLELLKKYGYSLPASNDQAENGELKADECVSPFVRKAPYHFGWDWGPRFVTSGIFRPIELISQNDARIDNVYYRQDKVDKTKASITAIVTVNSLNGEKAVISVSDKNNNDLYASQTVELKKGDNVVNIPVEIKNPRLWWTNGLGKQEMYNFVASVNIKGKEVSRIDDEIGLRSLKLIQKHDDTGNGTSCYIELNGYPVFMKGANHIPNDLFVDRMTKEVYDNEISNAKNANMNMLRVWGGGIYEDDYFYRKCDEEGILIWQDFMFACSMYPDDNHFYENVRQEAIDNVKRLRNHACIALWCGNNEIDCAWAQYDENAGWGWKQKMTAAQREQSWKAYQNLFYNILPEVVSQYDTRSYRQSSPMVSEPKHHSSNLTLNDGDVHYWGVWHAKEPFENYHNVLGRFMSEYGFQSFPDMNSIKQYSLPEDYDIESEVMKSHQRSPIGNSTILEYMKLYYKVPNNFKDFIYLQQVLQAEGIRTAIEAHRQNMPHTMGSLYWQINDCWPVASWSSTDYYRHWKALHYFAKKAFVPLLLTAKRTGDDFEVMIVSDKLSDIQNVEFSLDVITPDGNKVSEDIVNRVVPANSSTSLWKVKWNKLFTNPNQFAVLKAKKDGKVIAQNIFYPSKIKDMTLPKSNVNIEILATDNNRKYIFRIASDKLVKNLYLDESIDGYFSDNYMDILPGEKRDITFVSNSDVSIKEMNDSFSYNTISK